MLYRPMILKLYNYVIYTVHMYESFLFLLMYANSKVFYFFAVTTKITTTEQFFIPHKYVSLVMSKQAALSTTQTLYLINGLAQQLFFFSLFDHFIVCLLQQRIGTDTTANNTSDFYQLDSQCIEIKIEKDAHYLSVFFILFSW